VPVLIQCNHPAGRRDPGRKEFGHISITAPRIEYDLPGSDIQRLQDEVVVQKPFREFPAVRMPWAIRRVVFLHPAPAVLFDRPSFSQLVIGPHAFQVLTTLFPFEQCKHQRQVALDLILLVQKHLLTVRFASHDIHPDLERGLDGQIGAFTRTFRGLDAA